MHAPQTLLQLAQVDLTPAKTKTACLILIDMQNEYVEGPIAVPDSDKVIANAAELLSAARFNQTPILHVAHKGPPGSLFDRDHARGKIVSALHPLPSEQIIVKQLPNAFAGTELDDLLKDIGRKDILIGGFMTHMCVSSTARVALDLGYRTTIAATACGTRDLPDGDGGTLSADVVHKVALAELSDRFAIIARDLQEVI